jgi:trehalose 6-phosphate synthase
MQVVVPSREEIPSYQNLKNQIEGLVAAINQQFGTRSWVPIRYRYGHLSRKELVAHYRAVDIALVTPLRDGMNLVAKEFCASRVDETGMLILSEFAGAAAQLRTGAYLVNPRNISSIASALHDAIDPNEADVRRRMRRMRRNVKVNDVHRWCEEGWNGTAACEGGVTTSARRAAVGTLESWQVQIPLATPAADAETP